MADTMGFFDFFNRQNPTTDPADRIKQRWLYLSDGLIKDNNSSKKNHYAARFSTKGFETWFLGLEQRLGQSLGRRLAHAALEHQEYFFEISEMKKPSGRDLNNWPQNKTDWQTRGLGEFSKLEDEDEVRILVESPASSPICSGLVASAWEIATGKRHRFVWTQASQESVIVTLNLDHKALPTPSRQLLLWPNSDNDSVDYDLTEESWEDLRLDSRGLWSILNERKMIIHRDLISRFEEFCLPYLTNIESGRQDIEWPIEDVERNLWWSAAADSMRQVHFDSGIHVLISKPDDWIGVGRRHLSINGLGGIEFAESIDEHGGVKITLKNTFHPAISGGVLLACWERAHGRRGKLKCRFDSDSVALFLSSSVEIAN